MQTVPPQKSEIDPIESEKPCLNLLTSKCLRPAFGIRDQYVYGLNGMEGIKRNGNNSTI